MRRITLDNYEEIFLDYLEGNLSVQEQIVLEEFLAIYPELKEELDEMEMFSIIEEEKEIDKIPLKEIPFRKNFSDFCIARLEGDLNMEESASFDEFVYTNPDFEKEVRLFKRTKLEADTTIIYPNKKLLQKKERRILPLWYSGVGVAASVLLLFSVWNNLFNLEELMYKEEKSFTVLVNTPNEVQNVANDDQREKVTAVEEVNNVITESPIVSSKASMVRKPNVKVSDAHHQRREVSLPQISQNIKTELLANTYSQESRLDSHEIRTESGNTSGLEHLGMSWKSSVPKKKKQNTLLYAVAKYGVDKLGEIAGKKIQLEKSYDSETETTRLNFNTKGIGFSTTVK